jgi:chromosome segregation ATPase
MASNEKEVKLVELHNRGLRRWTLPGDISIDPGESKPVPEDVAKHFAKDNPRELILASDLAPAAGNRIKVLEAANAQLEKELADKQARIQQLEAEGDAALVQENTELKEQVQVLTEEKGKLDELCQKLKDKIKELQEKVKELKDK